MAYEPKTWECGDVVTAEALNHIEQGIAESEVSTVEIIKLGTATGGLIPLARSGGQDALAYAFEGGFSISGGQNVGDLIGDKKLINIAFDGQAANIGYFPLIGQVYNTDGNFLTMDDSVLKTQTQGGVSGFAKTGSGTPSTATVDVYAICI